jgi:hypothetical protein
MGMSVKGHEDQFPRPGPVSVWKAVACCRRIGQAFPWTAEASPPAPPRARRSTFLTVCPYHRPPRAVRTPRALSACAIPSLVAIPLALMPSPDPRGFLFDGRLSVGDGETDADREGGELIDRVATGAPIRQLILIEALRHARMPFAGVRADQPAGIEPAAIDAHGAAKVATDLKRGLR